MSPFVFGVFVLLLSVASAQYEGSPYYYALDKLCTDVYPGSAGCSDYKYAPTSEQAYTGSNKLVQYIDKVKTCSVNQRKYGATNNILSKYKEPRRSFLKPLVDFGLVKLDYVDELPEQCLEKPLLNVFQLVQELEKSQILLNYACEIVNFKATSQTYSSASVYAKVYTESYTNALAESLTSAVAGAYSKTYSQVYAAAYAQAFTNVYVSAYADGFVSAFTQTFAGAFASTFTKSFTSAFADVFSKAFTDSFSSAYTEAFAEAYAETFSEAYVTTYTDAFISGDFTCDKYSKNKEEICTDSASEAVVKVLSKATADACASALAESEGEATADAVAKACSGAEAIAKASAKAVAASSAFAASEASAKAASDAAAEAGASAGSDAAAKAAAEAAAVAASSAVAKASADADAEADSKAGAEAESKAVVKIVGDNTCECKAAQVATEFLEYIKNLLERCELLADRSDSDKKTEQKSSKRY